MKKFHYRLENVLAIRKQQEKIEQKKYAEINSEYQNAVQIMKDLYQRKKDTYNNLNDMEKNQFDKRIRMIHVDFIEKTNLDIDLQRLNIEKIEVKLKKQRKILVETMQKKEILEKLKEKKIEEYNLEMKLFELKILDEIGSQQKIDR